MILKLKVNPGEDVQLVSAEPTGASRSSLTAAGADQSSGVLGGERQTHESLLHRLRELQMQIRAPEAQFTREETPMKPASPQAASTPPAGTESVHQRTRAAIFTPPQARQKVQVVTSLDPGAERRQQRFQSNEMLDLASFRGFSRVSQQVMHLQPDVAASLLHLQLLLLTQTQYWTEQLCLLTPPDSNPNSRSCLP